MEQLARLAALLFALSAVPAMAERDGTLRIGVLNDMSSVYADFQGPGSVVAAQMAVEDFAKHRRARSRCSPPITRTSRMSAPAIARRWFDDRRRRHDRRPAELGGRARGRRRSRARRTRS